MSSNEDSDSDDVDYAPSDGDASHSADSDNSSGDESDTETRKSGGKTREKQAKLSGENLSDNVVPEKTEDELWNEFLQGADDGSAPGAEKSQKADSGSVGVQKRETVGETSGAALSETIIKEFGGAAPDEKEKPAAISNDIVDASNERADSGNSSLSKNGTGSQKCGMAAILAQIDKKKTSTLERSKRDWESFKRNEGLHEELSTFNKGKDGYLNRKEFLERADYRQFEKERDMRAKKRKTTL